MPGPDVVLATSATVAVSGDDTIDLVTTYTRSGPVLDSSEDPARALAGYRRGDFFLATEDRTILASGEEWSSSGADLAALDEQLAGAFSDSATPIAVGVLPFASGSAHGGPPARLVVPARLRLAGPAHDTARRHTARVPGAPARFTAVPSPAAHAEAVATALRSLHTGAVRKVVLARALDAVFEAEIDPTWILRNLVADNPDGYTFAVGLPGSTRAPRTLIGSSPELLVRRTGSRVVSHPHAGSAPRSADPGADRANAEALLASAKDQAEHAMVTEAVVEALRPYCRRLSVPTVPSLTSTPAVWHLGTAITAELRDPDVSAFRLAAALHPTPAICGTPTESARELVARLEPFDREYYAGAVGWVDAAGDGEWAVAIRCAELAGRSMRLYAGGGIVAASDPQSELDETSAKFQTLLRAMGLDPRL